MISEMKVKAVLTHGAKNELFYTPGAVAKRAGAIEAGNGPGKVFAHTPFLSAKKACQIATR